jgi:hypothetical protein
MPKDYPAAGPASMRVSGTTPNLPYSPTAVHVVGLVQSTLLRVLSPVPRAGLGMTDQEAPFQVSTSVFGAELPTATHAFEARHDTASSVLLCAVSLLGLGTMDQPLPFQLSTSVRSRPEESLR